MAQVRAQIPGYQRPEESTYLTYPEWAIVYAAREYAGFVERPPAERLPLLVLYRPLLAGLCDGDPREFAPIRSISQNHQMLAVIGTSHTIEHALQWAYENTIGRITEATAGGRTAADDYQAKVAADYAAFLDQVPWYQFPYAEKRAGLMALSPARRRRLDPHERAQMGVRPRLFDQAGLCRPHQVGARRDGRSGLPRHPCLGQGSGRAKPPATNPTPRSSAT